MTWEELCKLGRALPEVTLGTSYGTPCLKVRTKMFVRLKEDRKSVVCVVESVDEQQMLIETQPAIYFITDHYVGWPLVLARLSKLRVAECRLRLDEGWRLKAPKTLLKKHGR